MFNKLWSMVSGHSPTRDGSSSGSRRSKQDRDYSTPPTPVPLHRQPTNDARPSPRPDDATAISRQSSLAARTPRLEGRREPKRIEYIESPRTQDPRSEGRRGGERSRRKLEEKNQALKEENSSLTALLQGSQQSLADAMARSGQLQRTVNQLMTEREAWSAEKTQWLAKEKAWERDKGWEKGKKEMEDTVRRQESDIRRLHEKLRRADDKNAQLERLLAERTADLKGAQAYLTTVDIYSGADVLKMVEGLNAEVFQLSASVAELVDEKTMTTSYVDVSKLPPDFEKYQHSLRGRVGQDLMDYLVQNRTRIRQDPLCLQLALQALLSWWIVFMTERFCGGDAGKELLRLYSRVRQSEPQSVSGRWRSLTSEKLKVTNTETYIDSIVEMILSLLSLCGWPRSSRESQNIILSIQAGVENLSKLWLQLKAAMKEGVTTVDMRIFNFDPGETFDPRIMEDAYPDATPQKTVARRGTPMLREIVLCTLGIGLERSVIDRETGEDQIDVSLKPKVALTGVLAMDS